ncbi:MAG: amino acid-binding protein [Halobacteria archaeon]
MWGRIMSEFSGSPGQKKVIKLLLERGFSVNDDGRVVSGEIELPDAGIAREVGVDRRVVDATTEAILNDPELREIFENISSIPSLRDVAPVLDLGVLIIAVEDASEEGVIAGISELIAEHGVSIRQAISDDPYFTDEPTFTVITNGEVPGELVADIKKLDYVEKVDFR